MATIEKSIEVHVPVQTVYNQWTQFEEFPQFMEGVEEVRQIDDTHLHWKARIGGKPEEWDAEISDQSPDRRVSWYSTSGAQNDGTVMFESIDPQTTRVDLVLEYQPQGVTEHVGDMLGVTSRRVEGDLRRFKDFIEARGTETGAWRGQADSGQSSGTTGTMRSSMSQGSATSDDIMGGTSDYPVGGRSQRAPAGGSVDNAPESVGSQTDFPGPEGVGDRTDFPAGGRADYPPEGIGDRTDVTLEGTEGRTKPTGS
jgi:uncharacterized membrane protein